MKTLTIKIPKAMKISIFIASLLIFTQATQAQELVNINQINTCQTAMTINTLKSFGPTTPPQAAPNNNNPLMPQKREAWYKFTTEKDGKLLFDIIPLDSTDNYDYILFKVGKQDFCKNISQFEPIRSNFEKVNPNLQGRTGLSVFGDEQGFDKAIDIKVGQEYYLNVLSMYESKGHAITFTYHQTFNINGKLTTEQGQPVNKARIVLANQRTGERSGMTDDIKKGEFEMEISLSTEPHRFPKYMLEIYSPKFILFDTIFTTEQIANLNQSVLEFNLIPLKKGVNDSFGHIYFDPNSPNQIVHHSYKTLDKLCKTMQLNESITIEAQGHTNGFYPSTDVDLYLSEDRAQTVKKYLTEKGIDPERITVKGFGSKALKFPKAENEFEESQNRRVEIFFEKIK